MAISIRNIIFYGQGDGHLPLTGMTEVFVTLERSGNVTIDVPSTLHVRGYADGVLSLVGTGNASLYGDLAVWRFDTSELIGNFDQGEFHIVMRPIYVAMGYVVSSYAANVNEGYFTLTSREIIQDAGRIDYSAETYF